MSGRPTPMTALVGAVLAAAGLTLALVAPAASATVGDDSDSDGGSASQFVSIDLELLGEVSWQPRRPVPVEVTVEASRAVSGLLQLVDEPEGGGTTTWEFDLDLAAGSVVRLPVTLTTGWNGVYASAVFRSGGEGLASAELRRGGTGEGSDQQVAVLGIDDPPRRLIELGTDRTLPTFELTPDMRALADSGTLVAAPVALREMDADSVGRLSIDAWVRGGGQLVVDGPRQALDDAYHRFPTANPDRFAYGAGSILYDEGWRDGIPLGGYVGTASLAQLVESQGLGSGAGGELALLGGLALPGAGVVAAVLLGYAVLAGPVLFIVAGRTGRENRIWTVVPVLAVVAASGILLYGFIDRSGRSDAHITIVEVGDEGSRVTTNLLLGSGLGGNRQLETPEGWRYLGQGQTSSQRPIQLRVGRTTTAVGIEMPSGSSAVVRMSGVDAGYDGLVTIDGIEAGDDGTIRAEVTNHSDVTLHEAVAFLGNARAEIGDLPPDQPTPVAVDPGDGSTRTMRELLLWPRVRTQWNERGSVAVPTDDDVVTAAGAWTEWRIEQGTTASPENVLGVAAWTDELPSPLGDDDGHTALFARANVPAGVSAATGFSTVARPPTYSGEPVFDGNFVGYQEDLRLTVDSATDPADLAIGVDGQSSAVGVWFDDAWRWVELPAQGRALIELPPEAVVDGEVLLRSFQPEWAWGTGSTIQVVAGAGADEAEPAVLSDTINHRAGREPGPDVRMGPGMADLEVSEEVEIDELDPDEPFVSDEAFLQSFTQAVYRVTLAEGDVLVATMRSSSGGDSYLELWDERENILEQNDDFGEGVDSQIVFEATEAGTYEIRARELNSQEIEYQLTLELES